MSAVPQHVPAQGVIDASRDGKFLAQQHYLVMSTSNGSMDRIFEHLEAHLQYHVQLVKDGIEFAAGPIWTDDEKSWEGVGLMVFKTASFADADALAAADPMHTSGARSYQVTPWLINHGILES